MKKKIIVPIISILILTSLAVVGVTSYNNYQTEMTISALIESVQEKALDFDAETDRNIKLSILKEVRNEYINYLALENGYTEVESIYETTVEKMEEIFKNEYTELITSNTIIDIETITDKEQLNKNIQILEDILSMIKEDEVCDKKQMDSYENQIKELMDTYSNKVASIEAEEAAKKAEEERLAQEAAKKAEEERIAKEKAEAERKAKEEAEKRAEAERLAQAEKDKEQDKNNSNNNNNNNQNNLNSSNNNSYENPNKKKYSSFEEVERLIAEGVITEWSRYDCEDGTSSIKVWYYNYLNTGEIFDLRDPVFGYHWDEE